MTTAAVERSCRTCHGPLQPILTLGDLTLPVFLQPGDPPGLRATLDLRVCDECALVQLAHTVPPDLLYRQYWYRSSINGMMRAELTDIVKAALLDVSVYPQDLVIDVGANDGFLLSQYPTQRAHWAATRIAFEPAANLRAECDKHCDVLIPHYFPPAAADIERMPGVAGRVKILTSIAMFYDLDDPAAFVRAVDRLLAEDGVWILQFQDLAQMIQATAVDNICHEHLTYWSLAAFIWFLERCSADLHVTHVERRAINGGSLRIHVRRHVYPVDRTIEDLRALEEPHIGWQALERFAWQAEEVRRQITGTVGALLVDQKTIDLYGASTKANTLLQWCRLSGTSIRQAWERNPDKIGLVTATGIPIISEPDGREDAPDVLFAGIWQFRESILEREHRFLEDGGAILFPLPEVDVVTHAR
jgi:hypothetical protein